MLKLWKAVKVMLRVLFTAVNIYILIKRSQINNLTFHFKKLEKGEQTKASRRKEVIKIELEVS